MRLLVNAFNAGELSPELAGRFDLEKLRKACAICRNNIPRTLGGTRRRPGMMHLGSTNGDQPARLLPFAASAADRYVLEFGSGYMRIWKDGERLPVELAAPWTEAQIAEVQSVQVNDLVFFVHPKIPVHELRRISDASWTLAPFAWKWPAMRDENTSAVTMAYTAAAGPTPAQLTASASHFTSGDVGAYYQLTHARDDTSLSLSLLDGTTPDRTDGTLVALGAWDFYTTGNWWGTVYLETLDADGTWQVLRSYKSTADRNVTASGRFDALTRVRLRWVLATGLASGNPRAIFEPTDVELSGLVRIDSVTSPTAASVTVISPPYATTATSRWREGAWSARRGFPRAVALHQSRLTFAGTTSQPQTIWGSAVDDWNNFQQIDADDAAFTVQIAAQEANPIAWLASVEGLIVGTEGDEWLLDSTGGIISQSNPPVARRKTKFGSAKQQAQLVGGVVLFVQRGGRKVREYVYAFEESNYKALDLTQLADHLTITGGIARLAYAASPDPTLYAVTTDGRLLSCTYLREAEVLAWAPHDTAGAVEDVAVLPGDGVADEVWLVVARTVNGTTTRRVERFDPDHWQKMEAGTTAELVHLDAAVVVSPGGSTVTGLSHLEGEEVAIWADGAVQPSRRVTSGTITLQESAAVAVIGLPYTSTLQPFAFDVADQAGPNAIRAWHTPTIRLQLWQTGPMDYADSPAGPFYAVPVRDGGDDMDAAPPLFTGRTKQLTMQANHGDSVTVTLQTSAPGPMNILAILTETAVYG
jgi:hypothetical protein